MYEKRKVGLSRLRKNVTAPRDVKQLFSESEKGITLHSNYTHNPS